MNRPFLLFPALASAAALSACSGIAVNEIYLPHGLPHAQAFKEEPAGYSLNPGTGTVHGQVCLYNKDGSKFFGDDVTVRLLPVTDYTTEIVVREYSHGVYLSKPDPRLAKYVRTAAADGTGWFQFSRVPTGHYYVAGTFKWETEDTIYDDNNSPSKVTAQNSRKMYAVVEVKSGQAVTANGWKIGPERFK